MTILLTENVHRIGSILGERSFFLLSYLTKGVVYSSLISAISFSPSIYG